MKSTKIFLQTRRFQLGDPDRYEGTIGSGTYCSINDNQTMRHRLGTLPILSSRRRSRFSINFWISELALFRRPVIVTLCTKLKNKIYDASFPCWLFLIVLLAYFFFFFFFLDFTEIYGMNFSIIRKNIICLQFYRKKEKMNKLKQLKYNLKKN